MGAVVLGAVGAWVGYRLTPQDALPETTFIFPLVGGVVGVLGGLALVFLLIFLWNMKRAPYRQRNEARDALEKLSQTPLGMECSGFESVLWGDTPFGHKQYKWLLNVILTNQSDTQNIGTKTVSLIIDGPVGDGKTRRYALSLMPDTDRNGRAFPSNAIGRPLTVNEYLRPRQSVTGYYEFLDDDMFWKPKSIQRRPTLVVVDTLGAPHRKEFPRSRFASQLTPDTEGS